ncbi:MAG: hypothetical protein IKP30_03350 [Bacteroidaceae bacterium]|nr:hypothetical protein [Bacteroidaceae bacterium]
MAKHMLMTLLLMMTAGLSLPRPAPLPASKATAWWKRCTTASTASW